jgi:hypothetical protein
MGKGTAKPCRINEFDLFAGVNAELSVVVQPPVADP